MTPIRLQFLVVGCAFGVVLLWMLRFFIPDERPAKLWFVQQTNQVGGARMAFLCFSNCASSELLFFTAGKGHPYYQLVETISLPTIPKSTLITNYNFDRMFRATPASLPGHASVIFPVLVPSVASEPVVIVNYNFVPRRTPDIKETFKNFLWRLPAAAPTMAGTYDHMVSAKVAQ